MAAEGKIDALNPQFSLTTVSIRTVRNVGYVFVPGGERSDWAGGNA